MTLNTRTKLRNYKLDAVETRRIRRQFDTLGRRLAGSPDPLATLLLVGRAAARGVEAHLRVRRGHLGGHLVAREVGNTADHAVRQAVEQIERQLDRKSTPRRLRRPAREVELKVM